MSFLPAIELAESLPHDGKKDDQRPERRQRPSDMLGPPDQPPQTRVASDVQYRLVGQRPPPSKPAASRLVTECAAQCRQISKSSGKISATVYPPIGRRNALRAIPWPACVEAVVKVQHVLMILAH